MKALKLTNSADVAFSASSASTGGHRTLGHVPGSALWGVVAADRYRTTGRSAFDVAHSGDLRVSPAFPLVGGKPAFPAPQTLRRPKHDPGGQAWNTVWRWDGAGETFKGAYVTGDGDIVRPSLADRGKAAMHSGERRAADGEYFQYEHLDRGQDWLAWVDGEGAEEAAAALSGHTLRLGRSRMPEYGGAFACEMLATWEDPRSDQWAETAEMGKPLVLWCLSDLACVDERGSPTLTPMAADLGVGDFPGQLDPGRSAISGRRYAPWNTYLNAPDREHAVIEAGSVLVFELEGEVKLDLFREGCGRWRERGLGLVWPNPPLLMMADPVLRDLGVSKRSESLEGGTNRGLPEAEARVVAALRDRRDARKERDAIANETKRLTATILKTLEAAKSRGELTPGPSQWAQLATIAEGKQDLVAALFGKQPAPPSTRIDYGLCVGQANLDWQAVEPTLRRIVESGAHRQALARAAWRLRAEWTGGGG